MEEFLSPLATGAFLAGVVFTSVINIIGFSIFFYYSDQKRNKGKMCSKKGCSNIPLDGDFVCEDCMEEVFQLENRKAIH